jgi:hypothetical protein
VQAAVILAQGGISSVGLGEGDGDGLGEGDGLGDGVGVGVVFTEAVDDDPQPATTSTVASASSPTLRLTGHSNGDAWRDVTDRTPDNRRTRIRRDRLVFTAVFVQTL